MSNARKKVIVRRFTGDTLPGYLPLSGFVHGQSPAQSPVQSPVLMLDLLDLSGRMVQLPLNEIKTVSFVRDFNLADTVNPERLTRRHFLARPRNEGLWVRLSFRSPEHTSDLLEGLADTGLSLLDSLIQDSGISISPPDIRSNTQRIFVPRSALVDIQLLAVVTSPSRKPVPAQTAEQQRKALQDSLFETTGSSTSRPN